MANSNDAPTVANVIPDQNATEDTAYSFQFNTNSFSDVDVGDTLTYTALQSDDSALPAWLSFTAATRTFSGTPANGDVGTLNLKVTASDGTLSVSDVFSLTVANSNDLPTGTNKTISVDEDATYTFLTTDFGFLDVDVGDSLAQVKITQLEANGSLTLSGADVTLNQVISTADITAGNLKFAPVANQNGTGYDTFQFKVHDATDYATVANTLTVDVTAQNDTPVNTVPGAQSINEDATLTFNTGNGNLIQISDDASEDSSSVQVALSVVSGTVTLSQTTGLTFSVGDGTSDASMTFTGSVTNINSALDGLSYVLPADGFGTDTLTINTDDQGNRGVGGALSDNDTVAITINPLADTPSITTASSNEDTQTSSGLVISRNVADGAEVSFFKITNITNGSLFQNDGTTPINENEFLSFADANAGLRFTPTANLNSTNDSFSFDVQAATAANDGSLGGSVVTRTLTINAINDAPTDNLPVDQTTPEDVALVFNAANANAITLTDDASEDGTDVEVSLSVVSGVLSLSQTTGLVFTVGDGTDDASMTFTGSVVDINTALEGLSYVSPLHFFGADVLSMSSDDQGNAGVGGNLTDSDTLNITITSVNDAPGVGGLRNFAVDMDGGDDYVVADLPTLFNDIPNNDITVEFVARVDDLKAYGTWSRLFEARFNNNNFFQFNVPQNNRVQLTVEDNNTQRGVTSDVLTEGVWYTFSGVWHAATNSLEFYIDGQLQGNPKSGNAGSGNKTEMRLGSRTDNRGELDGAMDEVRIWSVARTQAELLSTSGVALVGDEANLVGYWSFDEGQGTTSSDWVTGANDMVLKKMVPASDWIDSGLPVVDVQNKVGVDEDGVRFIQLMATDVDNDDATLGFRMTTLPANGTLYQYNAGAQGVAIALNDLLTDGSGRLYWQPDADFNGTDSFQFKANDGLLDSVTAATVNLTVDPINDEPVNTIPGAQSVPEDGLLTFSVGNGNTLSVADVDAGADLKITLTATKGTTTLSQTTGLVFSAGDGTSDAVMTFTGNTTDINLALEGITFTPDLEYAGNASLEIKSDDQGNSGEGGALSDTDTINITVTPSADLPRLTPSTLTTDEDTQTAGVRIRRSSLDGGEVGFFKITNITGGTLYRNDGTTVVNNNEFITSAVANSRLRFTPSANLNSSIPGAVFSYGVTGSLVANDTGLGADTATVVITVDAVNDAPINTLPVAQTLDEDGSLVFSTANGNAVSVADDASDDDSPIETTLTVTNGTLTVAGGSGATITTNGTASVIVTGTVDQVNTELQGLKYQPTAGYSGTDTLQISTDDQGNTGSGGALVDTDTFNITINAMADTPTLTAATTNEDNQTTSGLVISRNPTDGAEVAFFKISNIVGGTLFQNDGTTSIDANDFISFVQANAGLKFTPTANLNTGSGDTFSFDVQASLSAVDGGLGGGVISSVITVNSINDLPVVTAGAVGTFTENDAAMVVDAIITLSDVDHTNVDSATVTINGGYQNGADLLAFTDTGTITGVWSSATGQMALSGSDSLANYQAALRSITFINTSETPTNGNRTLSFVVNDGVDNSLAVTSTINVVSVIDVPTVTAGGVLNMTEGDVATAVDGMVTVSDLDDINLEGATLSITTGYQSGEDQLTFTDANGITGGWNGATGVLTLSGSASKANYQTALRSVLYNNTAADDPTPGARTVSFIINDGDVNSSAATSTINMASVNDLPVLTAGSVLTFNEGDSATVMDGTITVTDGDDTNLNGSVISISSGFVVGEDSLTFNDANGITGSWNGATGVLTLSGVATKANYQTALRTVLYSNSAGDNPTSGNRTLSYVANDGDGDGVTVTSTVSVVASNDKPVMTSGGSLTFTEGDAATVVDASVTLVDVDDTNLEGATLTLSAGFVSGEDLLTFVDTASITGSWNGATGVMSLTGTATLAEYQTALRSITYTNSAGDSPTSGLRTLSFVVNDGDIDSTTVTSAITVNKVNDLPVLTAGGALIYTEGDGNGVLDAALVVTDQDHTTLQRAQISIGAGFVSGEDVLNFTDTASITGSWNGATGVLTLTGVTTVNDYQTALRSVTYSNSAGDNPTSGVRTLSLLVDDGDDDSLIANTTVSVVPVNDASTLSAGGVLNFTENDAATVIDNGIILADVDDTNFESATITISTGYLSTEDSLGFVNANGITGVWNGVGGVLSLTGSSSIANYQAALRSVTYSNSDGDTPTSIGRTVTFVVNDGDVASSSDTATITVTSINDAPLITVPAAQNVNEEANLIFTGVSVLDVDVGGGDVSLSLTVNDGVLTLSTTTGLTFVSGGDGQSSMVFTGTPSTINTALNGLTYTGDLDFSGADVLSLLVSDLGNVGGGGIQTDNATVNITVNAVQDAPNAGVDGLLTDEDTDLLINVANDLLINDSDPDGDVLSLIGFTQTANGTLVDNGDGTLTYNPDLNYNGADTFIYTVDDGQGNTDTATVTIVVDPIPDALSPGDDALNLNEDIVTLSGDFLDNDRDPDYNVGLPDFGLNPALSIIGFTAASDGVVVYNGDGTFTYTPNANFFGVDTIDYTLNAGDARIGTGTVTFTVASVNDQPLWNNNTGITVNEDDSVTVNTVDLQVTDVDQGATDLTYTLTTSVANGDLKKSGVTLFDGETFSQEDIDLGNLTYLHDGTETVADFFNVTVADGVGGVLGLTSINITINPQNDLPVLAVNGGVSVNEGDTVTIDNGPLTITDVDNTPSQIVLTVSQLPTVGVLKLNGTTLALNDGLTQTDINNNVFTYLHDGSETTSDLFKFTVSDGAGGSLGNTDFSITITPQNDAPTLVTNTGVTLNEGATIVLDNTRLQVTDVDNTTLETVYQVTALPDNGQLLLSGVSVVVGGTFSQEDLDNNRLSYSHDGSDTLTDTFKFTLSDGSGGTIPETIFTNTITPVNDAPISTAGATLTFTENDAATVVDNTLTLNDSDNATLQGATVTIDTGYLVAEDRLSFTDIGTINGSWDQATGIMSLSGVGTVAEYQSALRSITYDNLAGENPTGMNKTVSWIVNDGSTDSVSVTSSILIIPTNDKPTMTAGGVLAYTEGQVASVVDATLTVSDWDDLNMEGVSVVINGGYVASEDRLGFVDVFGITGNWNNGTLTLSGSATLADYQTAVRSITYENINGDNPVSGTRTLSFLANDGDVDSNTVTSQVVVTSVNDQPVVTAGGTLSVIENDADQVMDLTITVVDVDDTHLQSATLTINSGYDSGNDQLNFTDTSGIVGSWDAANGILTLVGSATTNDYQTALRSVTFQNTSDDPSSSNRQVQIKINDGDAESLIATSTITLTPVNDRPDLSGLVDVDYDEGDGVNSVTNSVVLNDWDDTQFEGASVSITSGYVSSEDVLAFTNINGISGSWSGLTGVLSLTGTATLSDYQTALRSITFENSDVDNPTGGERVLSFTVNDGTLASVANTLILTVNPSNDAPTIGAGSASTFTEGDGVLSVDGGTVLSDPDNATLQSATLTINGGYQSDEDVLNFTDVGGIVGDWNQAAGILTLSGSATIADYQSALRTITYQNTGGDAPTAGVRTVSFVVNDGTINSTTATSTLTVVPVNDPSVLTAGSIILYNENDPATVVDATLTLLDQDDATLLGATVDISVGFKTGEDVLTFTDTVNITSTWDGATGVLTLNGNATVDEYRSALASISYENSDPDTPTSGNRTIRFLVNDGEDLSLPVTSVVTVLSVNDAPVITAGGVRIHTEGDAFLPVDNAITLVDVDDINLDQATLITFASGYQAGEDQLTYTDTANITGAWDTITGTLTLSGSAPVAEYETFLRQVIYENLKGDNPTAGVRTLQFSVNDGNLESVLATSTINVVPVNDLPVLNTDSTLAYTEGDLSSVVNGLLVVDDVDDLLLEGAEIAISEGYFWDEDVLAFTDTATLVGSWDVATGVLTLQGSATVSDYQNALRSVTYENTNTDDPVTDERTIRFTVLDGEGDSNSVTSVLSIANVNDAPVVTVPLALNGFEETNLTIGGLGIQDVDVEQDGTLLSAALTVSDGILTLNSTTGLTFISGGDGQSAMVIEGSLSDINTALNDLTYQGRLNYFGSDQLMVQVSDQGGSGLGGSKVALGSVSLTIAPLQDDPVAGSDVLLFFSEDVAKTITVATELLANDSDVDGDIFTLVGFTQPANGILADNLNGTLTYTPNVNFFGVDGFTYTINDGQGGSDVGVVTVIVDPVEDALVAGDDSGVVLEDGILTTVNVLDNDRDPDFLPDGLNPALDLIGFSQTINGVVTYNGGGVFTYTPNGDFFGTDMFNYTLNDGSNRIDQGVVTFTVNSVNDAPQLVNSVGITLDEGQGSLIDSTLLSVADVDHTSTELTFTLDAIPTNGLLQKEGLSLNVGETFSQFNVDSGHITYLHDGTETTDDNFIFTVADGLGETLFPADFAITINLVNDLPVLNTNIEISLDEGGSVVVDTSQLQVTDADNTSAEITYTLVNKPANGTLSLNGAVLADGEGFSQLFVDNGLLVYVHDGGETTVDGFDFTVADGSGGGIVETMFSFTINPVNDLPQLMTLNPLTLDEGEIATLDTNLLMATDEDHVNSEINYRVTLLPTEGLLNLDGQAVVLNDLFSQADVNSNLLVYQHDDGEAVSDFFKFIVVDALGGSLAEQIFFININPINDIPLLSAGADTLYTENDSPLLLDSNVTLSDADNTTLAKATVSIDSGYVPGEDRLNVGQVGSLTILWDDATGTLSLNGSATLSEYQVALRTVTYDNQGGEDPTGGDRTLKFVLEDGQNESLPSSMVVSVVEVNDFPVLTVGGVLAYTENDGKVAIDPFLTLTDPDSTTLTAAWVDLIHDDDPSQDVRLDFVNQNGISAVWDQVLNRLNLTGVATVSHYQTALQSVLFVHDNGDNPKNAQHTVLYQVQDGDVWTDSVSAVVAVISVNDAPEIQVPSSLNGDEDRVVRVDGVVLNDVDVENGLLRLGLSASQGILTLSTEDNLLFETGSNGTQNMVFSGTQSAINQALDGLNYQGNANYNGSDGITIQVNDLGNSGMGGSKSFETVIPITLNPVQDTPITGVDFLTTSEDTILTFTKMDLTQNDVDWDGDVLTITEFSTPSYGLLTENGDTLTYQPDLDYNGLDGFSYVVADGHGNTGSVWVSLVVEPVWDGLESQADEMSTQEDWVVVGDNVLANDRDPDYLPDGKNPALQIIGFTPAEHGTVVYEGDGLFSYTPDTNYFGSDFFTYTINAGDTRLATTTINLTVDSINDAPLLEVNTGVSLEEGRFISIDNTLLRFSDVEQEAAEILFTLGAIPEHGDLQLSGQTLTQGQPFSQADLDFGRLIYVHNGLENTSDLFRFSVSDGLSSSLGATDFSITILPVNDLPEQTINLGVLLIEGETIVIDSTLLKGVDSDHGADDLTYTINERVNHGQLFVGTISLGVGDSFSQGDVDANLVSYQHDGSDTLSDLFKFQLSDGVGQALQESSFSLTITPDNDAPKIMAPSAQSVEEDTPLLFNGLSIIDSDLGDNLMLVTLSAQHGNLTLSQVEGLDFSSGGNAQGSMAFKGSLDAVNTALNGLTYQGQAHFNGDDWLFLSVDDQGFSGNGGSKMATTVLSITVSDISDPPNVNPDLFLTKEDSPIVIHFADLLINDSDFDGDVLQVSDLGQPTHGTLLDQEDGSILYTPQANYFGVDLFSYTVTDGVQQTMGQVTVVVNPIPDILQAVDETFETREETLLVMDTLLLNDWDPDGKTVSIIGITQAENGVVVNGGEGSVSYVPNQNFSGTDTFTYTIGTGDQRIDTATVTIQVLDVNDSPTLLFNQGVTLMEGSSRLIHDSFLQVTDLEQDSKNIVYVLEMLPQNGTLFQGDHVLVQGNTFTQEDIHTNQITYLHDDSQTSEDGFLFSVLDGAGGFISQQLFPITIHSVNDAPVIEINETLQILEGSVVTLDSKLLKLSDVDNDSSEVWITLTQQPTKGHLSLEGALLNVGDRFSYVQIQENLIKYHHDGSESQTDGFYFSVSDGSGGEITDTPFRIHITPVDDLVTLTVPESQTVAEDETLLLSGIHVEDVDSPLTKLSLKVEHGTLTFENIQNLTLVEGYNGGSELTLMGTPMEMNVSLMGLSYQGDLNMFGSDTLILGAGNSDATSSELQVSALVNIEITPVQDVPIAGVDAFYIEEDAPLVINVIEQLLDNDFDGDGDTLQVTDFTQPEQGQLVDNGDGTFTYNPNADFNGLDRFSYTVSDGHGYTNSSTVVIVDPIEDRLIVGDDFSETREDFSVSIHNVLSNDQDPDYLQDPFNNPDLQIISFDKGSHGQVSYDGLGNFTYYPDADYFGTDHFSYTINTGDRRVDSGDIFVTVVPINDAPILETNKTLQILEGSMVTLDFNVLKLSDVDHDSSQVWITLTQLPENGQLTLEGESFNVGDRFSYLQMEEGFVRYQHDGGESQTDGFSFSVTDGFGGEISDTPFQIQIIPMDDLVTLTVPGLQTVAEDETLLLSGIHVEDVDTPFIKLSLKVNNGTLTFENIQDLTLEEGYNGGSELTLIGTPTQMNVSLMGLTYQGDLNMFGSDTLIIGAGNSDATSSELQVSALVDIEITPVQDTPIPGGDAFYIEEDVPLVIDVFGQLLNNDFDGDGDTLQVSDFTQPEHGQLVDNGDGTFTYVPNADFNGLDRFSYTVSDGQGYIASATVVIVDPIEDRLIVGDDFSETREDFPVSIHNALANDQDPDYLQDPFNNPDLQIISYTKGSHGQVSYDGLGNFTYYPEADYFGTDHFSYTINTGDRRVDTGEISVTVSPINDAPIISINTGLTVDQGEFITLQPIHLKLVDVDNTADDLHIHLVSAPSFGTLQVNGVSIVEGDSFSQSEIDQGLVTYHNSGTVNDIDGFIFSATDGSTGLIVDTQFTIQIRLIHSVSPEQVLPVKPDIPEPIVKPIRKDSAAQEQESSLPAPAGSMVFTGNPFSGANTPIITVVREGERSTPLMASETPLLTAVMNSNPGVVDGTMVTPVLTAVQQSVHSKAPGGMQTPVLTAVMASRDEGISPFLTTPLSGFSIQGSFFQSKPTVDFSSDPSLPGNTLFQGYEEESLKKPILDLPKLPILEKLLPSDSKLVFPEQDQSLYAQIQEVEDLRMRETEALLAAF